MLVLCEAVSPEAAVQAGRLLLMWGYTAHQDALSVSAYLQATHWLNMMLLWLKKVCFTKRDNTKQEVTFLFTEYFYSSRKLTQDSFPVNRTSSAYAVVFREGGLCKHPFTANSIKALGALLIGRLYFWLSSSPVLLPLRKGSAANVKLCDNRAIRHSTEFDPATSLHDGCEMIPSPPAQHDTLSTTRIHRVALPLSFYCVPHRIWLLSLPVSPFLCQSLSHCRLTACCILSL